jgi:hypothetical protein
MAHWPTEAELLRQARPSAARLRQLAVPGIAGEHQAFFVRVERETEPKDNRNGRSRAEDPGLKYVVYLRRLLVQRIVRTRHVYAHAKQDPGR